MRAEKALILGGGGREHALAWALERSGVEVHGFPGNAGFERVHAASPERTQRLRELLRQHRFDWVVLGSEQPAADGETDLVRNEFPEVFVVGPDQNAAGLESSKAFAKHFMRRNGIPTADFAVFSDPVAAENHIRRSFRDGAEKIVVKADGLAAGKGVVVAGDADEAVAAARAMLDGSLFGPAGKTVVVEEFLSGFEASVFVLTDGRDYVLLPTATDYKRRFDGHRGPNTGGMGAVSPSPFLDPETLARIEKTIVVPTLAGLRAEGLDYPGFLFFGLMIQNGDARVLEYNVRLGDPETQAILPRIVAPSLLDMLRALRDERLSEIRIQISGQVCVAVVCVSSGYPGPCVLDQVVRGWERAQAWVFFAGARRDEQGQVRTAGGRVLTVAALGDDFEAARRAAYQAVDRICFESIDFRKDIGTF
ncbi:MAG: phosphoribosylamine--glycine ligase [Bacteroidia bacterium]|nr:phosphoribosylamine--glycine ligase [Bacteroidia bacterium]